MKKADQIEEIIEGFKIIRQHLKTTATTGSSWGTSLTHSKWLALSVIARSPEVSVGELSNTLGISSSAATQLVNSLEQSGYVKRSIHKKDKRSSLVSLTAKTEAAFAQWRKQRVDAFAQLFTKFSEADFAAYRRLHNKLVSSIT